MNNSLNTAFAIEAHKPRPDCAYVLMTAAHNEELFIEKTILSVLAQTSQPQRWVIVSDNSSDKTDQIVETYAEKYGFIRFLRITRPPGRSFGLKVLALREGVKLLDDTAFDFIGNLDADVSLEPSYFEDLLRHFERDARLGLAAGFIQEERAGQFRNRRSNRIDSVPHAAQLVRRECYEEIGGYAVLKYGGEDWYAQICAKMKGWHAEAIPSLPVFHYRHTGAGTSLIRAQYRLGQLDYCFGSDPLFEILKCLGRLCEKPLFVAGIVRFAAFSWCYACRDKRYVSSEVAAFLRTEQRSKVSLLFEKFLAPVSKKGRNFLERAAKQLTP
jgi:glycosyltransferase involved in cell wall biosynthesis